MRCKCNDCFETLIKLFRVTSFGAIRIYTSSQSRLSAAIDLQGALVLL